MPRRIYLATAWSNHTQPAVLKALRDLGHEVYDFKTLLPEGRHPDVGSLLKAL